ncbi:sugar phosphate isomerase/epimerase [Flavobacteriaceae bacterium]|nr:sugar phosphate isomerase/epimerase [Flavobacteriaceae bacterium]
MITKKNMYSRRAFAKISALGVASTPLLGLASEIKTELFSGNSSNLEVYLFSKHLQFLDYNAMSSAAAAMGFDGLDLTVRRKGHVLPERVLTDLPKATEAMLNHGLKPKMMSTNVWDATNSTHKRVLETAASLGFTHYRTDWLKYPEDKSLVVSQLIYAKQAQELEQLNQQLGLIAGYQNHSGKYVGAPIWDLLPILEATKGSHIGSQYDIRHAVAEGGNSWELGLRRILPFINSICIKDFKWGKVNGKWKPINVPMGEGMVDFKKYFSILKKHKITVPVSLHVEHDLGGAEKGASSIKISEHEVFTRIKNDLDYLKTAWESSE